MKQVVVQLNGKEVFSTRDNREYYFAHEAANSWSGATELQDHVADVGQQEYRP